MHSRERKKMMRRQNCCCYRCSFRIADVWGIWGHDSRQTGAQETDWVPPSQWHSRAKPVRFDRWAFVRRVVLWVIAWAWMWQEQLRSHVNKWICGVCFSVYLVNELVLLIGLDHAGSALAHLSHSLEHINLCLLGTGTGTGTGAIQLMHAHHHSEEGTCTADTWCGENAWVAGVWVYAILGFVGAEPEKEKEREMCMFSISPHTSRTMSNDGTGETSVLPCVPVETHQLDQLSDCVCTVGNACGWWV